MATLKDIVADVKKCVKEGNPQSKCISEVGDKYDLDRDERSQLRKMLEK
jgi:hypothetical protein